MTEVITRFAPSPTGFLHIGGARTALFNYLFAKANGGKFLLRVEDTDRERSTDEAVDAIINGMEWLGLTPDEEPTFQFVRSDRHREVAEELLAKGAAYKCYTAKEELDKWREENPYAKFRSAYRDGKEGEGEFVVRLRAPDEGEVTVKDHIQGEITVKSEELDDMILLRSDGTPTYMLAVVVDDHDMGITHVVRGDDHLTNTFRQRLIYDAMGWDVPEFAHMALIHGDDGKKLSKRHGALEVEAYRDMGYLPEAMRNYLLRLGWSHGDDEIISDEQAIEWFNLEGVGKSPARFDFEKLGNLNHHYIREADDERLAELVGGGDVLVKAMPFLKERSNTLVALKEDTKWIESADMDEKAQAMYEKADKEILAGAIAAITAVEDWTKENIEAAFKGYLEANDYKFGQAGPGLRALVCGTMQSPGIFDVMWVLGKEETLNRLNSK